MSDIQIDCLMRKLVEDESLHNMKHCESSDHSAFLANKINYADKNIGLRESEAILVIKQLQEKVYFIIFINYLSLSFCPLKSSFIAIVKNL